MTAKTPAERQKLYRDNQKKKGWAKVELYLRPNDVPLGKALESASQSGMSITISAKGDG